MMEFAQLQNLGVGQESRGSGKTGTVFRNGLPFRGSGRPAPALGNWVLRLARTRAGVGVAVDWLPDVSWEVTVRRARL